MTEQNEFDSNYHYTWKLIEQTWEQYKTMTVMRVLNNGKWELRKQTPGQPITGTRAEVVKVNTVMGFPKFLKSKLING